MEPNAGREAERAAEALARLAPAHLGLELGRGSVSSSGWKITRMR